MAGRFDDKVLLVTGGGGGIGRAVAERFASEGARVALVDVDAVRTAFGAIDFFHNNASVLGALKPIPDYAEEVFDRVLGVNVKGVWLGLKRSAALEFADRGIRVNAICPAPIETNMVKALEAGAGKNARERLTATLPLKRFGEPAEVAALVAFLCSPDAAYITGGIYTVDGGAMA